MAIRRIRLPWQAQPPEATRADFDHPLARALDNLWLPDSVEPTDVIGGLRITGAPAGSAIAPWAGGRGLSGTTGGSAASLPVSRSAYPVVLVAYGTFTANNGWTLLNLSGSGGSLRFGTDSAGKASLIVRRNFGTSRTLTGTAVYPAGTPLCMIAQVFSDTDYRLYANGEQTNGTASFGTGGTWLTSQLPLAAQHPGQLFVAGQGFGRGSIPDDEARQITANPALLWRLFEPRALSVRVASASGATIGAGLSAEAANALALAARQIIAAGLAAEVGTALPLAARAVRTVGMAAESATALALTPAVVAPGTVGQAVEADTALALAARQVRAVGMAVETGSAAALGFVSARTAGLALEIGGALALGAVVRRPLGLAAESDAAQALLPGGASVAPPLSAPSIGRRLSTGSRPAQASDGQRETNTATGARAARLSTRTRA